MRDAYEEERPSLLALPDDVFPTEERVEVTIGKSPYARFDSNDYSVPHVWVRRSVTIYATQDRVRVLCGGPEMSGKPRPDWDRLIAHCA